MPTTTEPKTYSREEWQALSERTRHKIEKRALHGMFDCVQREDVERLRSAIIDGRLNGRRYWGTTDNPSGDGKLPCACVIGTLKFKTDADYDGISELQKCGGVMATLDTPIPDDELQALISSGDIDEDDDPNFSIVEGMVFPLSEGDTPQNNRTARLLLKWTNDWLKAN